MDPLYLSLILLAAGLVVFALEFFLPSAGMLGITCAICLCSSVVLAFMHHWIAGVAVLLVIATMIPLMFSVGVQIWPHAPIGKRILIGKKDREDVLPDPEGMATLEALVGQIGIAKSKMLPSGLVRIEDQAYDAVSDGFPIDEGDRVRVVAIRTKRVVVRPLRDSEPELVDAAGRDESLLSKSLEDLGFESLDDDISTQDSGTN